MLRRAFYRLRAGLWFHPRAIVSMLMIVSFGFANVGYPVWEPVVGKSGEAFPCQFSRCGCRTAEQCRTNCCCHTKQQKIAWALERGIEPDRVAILTEQERQEYALNAQSKAPVKLCCAKSAKPICKGNCCQTKVVGNCKRGCCSEAKRSGGLTFVLAIAAQKCSGTGVEWIQAGFVAVPPQPVKFVVAPRQASATDDVLPSYLPPVSGQLLRPA